MRLIDADALKEQIPETREDIFENCRRCTLLDASEVLGIIDEAPTIEAEPIRHGQWELSPFDGNWTCSKCGNKIRIYPYHNDMKNMNYCPNCGAKMDAPTQKSVGKALKALEVTK